MKFPLLDLARGVWFTLQPNGATAFMQAITVAESEALFMSRLAKPN